MIPNLTHAFYFMLIFIVPLFALAIIENLYHKIEHFLSLNTRTYSSYRKERDGYEEK